ncbi:MAG: hypothetical protein RR922_06150 [Clostridia bacterium]
MKEMIERKAKRMLKRVLYTVGVFLLMLIIILITTNVPIVSELYHKNETLAIQLIIGIILGIPFAISMYKIIVKARKEKKEREE